MIQLLRRNPIRRRSARAHVGERADAWASFRCELDRSRRYGHSFALALLPLAPNGSNGDARGNGKASDPARTAAALRSLVRSVDSVWTVGREAYVLFPQADRSAGLAALARIDREARGLASLRGGAGLAVFPEDGITSGALLDAVRATAEGSPASRVRGDGHATAGGGAAGSIVDGLVFRLRPTPTAEDGAATTVGRAPAEPGG